MTDLIEGRGLVMALLRSFGSRHMQREPSDLQGYVRDNTHLVGQETGAITPLVTMSLRVHSIYSQYSMGIFLLAFWTRGTEGSVLMLYVPGMLPTVSNEPRKAHFRAMMSWATTVGGVSV